MTAVYLAEIATPRVAAVHDLIRNRINGYIVPERDPQALAEAIETLGSEEKIMLFTEVEKREIPYIALKKVIAKRYNLEWLEDHVRNDLKLRVSIKRKGRSELVKVIAGLKKGIEEKVRGLLRRPKEGED